MDKRDVIILGGGIAGISAAVRLINHGVKPTIVERRPFLGGRAFSFLDRVSRQEIDNGQHVILGVCHDFLRLLSDLGTRNEIELGPVLDVPVWHNGRVAKLRADRVFGNVFALMRYRHLGIKDRLAISTVFLKIKLNLVDRNSANFPSEISFAQWLRRDGQSEATIDRFWSLFILPVFNCRIDEVAAVDAIEFTRFALLGSARDAAIGYPRKGLSSLIGTPATAFLRSHEADIKTNARVISISGSESGNFEVNLSSGETLPCKNLISTLTPNALAEVLPTSDDRFSLVASDLEKLQYSPIVAVHLWYEKPVMIEPVMAFLDLGLQWVFNDSALRNSPGEGTQHIVVSLSGADEWVALSKAEVLDRVASAMVEAFPAAQDNEVVNSAVVKTIQATIKVSPESKPNRMDTKTNIPGFYIAGDWTDTGLPATMEGAVKSGNLAADLAAQTLSR